MKESKKKSLTLWQIICLLLATFFMLVQVYNFGGSLSRFPLGGLLRLIPVMAQNATMIFVPMVFGAVYSKKKFIQLKALDFRF